MSIVSSFELQKHQTAEHKNTCMSAVLQKSMSKMNTTTNIWHPNAQKLVGAYCAEQALTTWGENPSWAQE